MRFVVVACLLAGCHPYIAGGVAPAWKMKGALASAVSEPIARTTAATTSMTPTTSSAPGNAYEVEAGSSYYDFFLGVNVQAHNLTAASLPVFAGGSMADGTPHYLNAIATLDIAWAWLHWKWVSSYIHAGPGEAILYDRSGNANHWGFGYRYGAGAAASWSRLSIYADLYKTGLVFGDGPATGYSSASGLTVGIAFHR